MSSTDQLTTMDDYFDIRGVCLLYKDNRVVGYTHTINEAEAICDKDATIQWDYAKRIEKINGLEMLTIHDF